MKIAKKITSLFLFFYITTMGFVSAQNACALGSYAVFSKDPGSSPVVLNKLGTSPQFGEIPNHTAASALSHLKGVYRKNVRKSRAELDGFFTAMGYQGFNDPALTAAKIMPETLPAGKTGWMGAYAKSHKFKWSTLGKSFPTFKIMSKDGSCYAYIMKKCGNAFYDPKDGCVPCTACDPNFNNPDICPNALGAMPKTTCAEQMINFNGKGKIQAGDVINTSQMIPVVASNNGQNLCLGEYNMPVRITYDMTATGEANYSKKVLVCDYGTGVPANANLNLPLNIKYMFGASDVRVGDDGKMVLAVSDKQFKTLKTVYKSCASDMAAGTMNKTLTGNNSAGQNSNASADFSNPDGKGCVKQTWNLSGNATTDEVSNKSNSAEVTMIGVYNKTGKLAKGESAEKNLCLGSYQVPAKSAVQYGLAGNTTMAHPIEVCAGDGTNGTQDVSIPVKLASTFTKQEVMVGDYGRVYVPLTKAQYNKLKKTFRRCCSDGSQGKCF